jgi:cytochrome P450
LRTEQGAADPYPLYAAARAAGPVLQDSTYSLVSTYDEADRVLRDPAFTAAPQTSYAEAAKVLPRPDPAAAADAGTAPSRPAAVSVLRANGEDHTRMRKALQQSFQRRRIRRLDGMVEQCARDLLEALPAGPERFDFMDAVGYQLPIAVICGLLGVPHGERRRIRELARARTIFLEPFPSAPEIDAAADARTELLAILDELVRSHRAEPQSDALDELLRTVGSHDPEVGQLTEAELFVNLSLLLIAGFETTAGLLGNAVALLLGRDGMYETLRARPDLIPGFVSEVLRYDPAVQLVTRVAVGRDAAIGGVPVPPGNLVMVLLGSAGRDPQRYPDPDEFAPFTRAPSPSLAFGAGAHYCLGAGLAQLEAEVLLRQLVGGSMRLAADGAGTRPSGRVAIRGFSTLPVRVVGSSPGVVTTD